MLWVCCNIIKYLPWNIFVKDRIPTDESARVWRLPRFSMKHFFRFLRKNFSFGVCKETNASTMEEGDKHMLSVDSRRQKESENKTGPSWYDGFPASMASLKLSDRSVLQSRHVPCSTLTKCHFVLYFSVQSVEGCP